MILVDDGLVLFFGLAPLLSYAFLRPQRQPRFLLLSMMAAVAMTCTIKMFWGVSWMDLLDFLLEVLLLCLIVVLVVASLAAGHAIWKLRHKTSHNQPDDQPTRVKSICFHRNDPNMVILALYSGHVIIYKDDKVLKYAVSPGCPVRACLFQGNDKFVAASDDHRIRVLDHTTGRLLHEFPAHEDYIRSLEIIQDDCLLLSCSDDMTIKLWDTTSYNCRNTYHGHLHYVMQVKRHPTLPRNFCTASLDRTIKFWSVDQTESLYTLEGHEDGVNAIDFLPQNNLLVSASDDLTVRLWNYETRQQLQILRGHLDNVTAVQFFFCHNNNAIGIVSTSEDCSLRFWRCFLNDEQDHPKGHSPIKIIQYGEHGRGWALATKSLAEADVENQVLAIGLDQACLILDIQHDTASGSIIVTNERNITNGMLENAHVPVVIHSSNGV